MISKVIQLSGIYQRQGATLRGQNITLKICPRKNTTPNKPETFLIAKTDKPKDRGQYISSLYPLSDSVYRLDYGGNEYHMTITPTTAYIEDSTMEGQNSFTYNTISR